MHELHRGPDCDGGERVEDLLDTLVKLSDILDLHPRLHDLQCPGEIGVTQTLESLVLEVQLLHGTLESLKIGCFVAERNCSEIFNPMLDWSVAAISTSSSCLGHS